MTWTKQQKQNAAALLTIGAKVQADRSELKEGSAVLAVAAELCELIEAIPVTEDEADGDSSDIHA